MKNKLNLYTAILGFLVLIFALVTIFVLINTDGLFYNTLSGTVIVKGRILVFGL